MRRSRLPARRSSSTTTIEWRETKVHVTAGFSPSGHLLEIFARSGRPDSDLDATVDDLAILLSLLLQFGAPLDQIGHSLGRLADGSSTSIAGAVVAAAVEIEKATR